MKTLKERLSAKLSRNGGFTLVEMLIVVAIIAILIIVSIPMIGSNLEKAREATDTANERSAMSMAETYFLLNSKDMTFDNNDKCKLYYTINKETHQGKIEEETNTLNDGNFKYGLSKASRTLVTGGTAGVPSDQGIIVTVTKDGDIADVYWGPSN